jgi:hypothetical protein
MKNKKFFGVAALSLGITLVSALSLFAKAPTSAHAAGNGVDNSKEKWSAIGTIQGSNWDKDFDLVYDSADDRYEVVLDLKANNEFKIRLNHAWGTDFGYGGNTGSNISTYLTSAGSNFKVKTANTYTLWVKDDNVKNYGDKSYGFGIEIYTATIAEYTVTYHFDETTTDTRTVTEIEDIPLLFEKVEGKRLEGWYTDETLTTKFNKGTKPTSDLHLYANYVEAENYPIYILDENKLITGSAYLYLWCDAFDGHNNKAWPGQAVSSENGFYEIWIDAAETFDRLILNNNGTKQTVDVTLDPTTKLYRLSSATGNVAVSTNNMDAAFLASYIMESDTAGQCTTKFAYARSIYLALSSTEQEAFLTHADAKARFEAWGVALGQDPYSTSSAARGILFGANDTNSTLVIVLVISLIAVGGFFAIKAIRKSRKEN